MHRPSNYLILQTRPVHVSVTVWRSTKCTCLPLNRKREDKQRNGKTEWIRGGQRRDRVRQGEQKGPITLWSISCTVYIIPALTNTHTHTHSHTHTHIHSGNTHMLTELAERKETDKLRWGWKCLAKRRWAWRRFSLLEHTCFSLLELRPVLRAVRDWKHLHVNVNDDQAIYKCLSSSYVCTHKCEHMCRHMNTEYASWH